MCETTTVYTRNTPKPKKKKRLAGTDLAFEALQEDVQGYVQYKIRGSKDEWYVEAYTRLGRLIKCKVARQPEDIAKKWVENYSRELGEMR